jgi:5-methyltetrahydropteroyltriglutamate--homocysteine methyltransferase
MILSYDVGSLPLRVEESVIWEGARRSGSLLSLISSSDATDVFEGEVVEGFVDKVKAGIDVPNFPQFRDMNEMYFELIRGIEKGPDGYMAIESPSAKPNAAVPEIEAIKKNASKIRELTGLDRVHLKVCVTGPYTLASFFPAKNASLFEDLGTALADIVSNSLFDSRNGEVSLVCIDEPVLGFLNDPLLDYGSDGREALIKAWDRICRVAISKGAETSMHLHDTSDDIFWAVDGLQLAESHVGDPLYTLDSTKRRLEETGKRLKASIAITLFDNLIEARLKAEGVTGEIQQKVGDVWTEIHHEKIDPTIFIEEASLMVKRLGVIIDEFGPENVPYAGPECGMGGWPSYEYAMEGLRRISEAVAWHSKKQG